jgi:hypothetical protein
LDSTLLALRAAQEHLVIPAPVGQQVGVVRQGLTQVRATPAVSVVMVGVLPEGKVGAHKLRLLVLPEVLLLVLREIRVLQEPQVIVFLVIRGVQEIRAVQVVQETQVREAVQGPKLPLMLQILVFYTDHRILIP